MSGAIVVIGGESGTSELVMVVIAMVGIVAVDGVVVVVVVVVVDGVIVVVVVVVVVVGERVGCGTSGTVLLVKNSTISFLRLSDHSRLFLASAIALGRISCRESAKLVDEEKFSN